MRASSDPAGRGLWWGFTLVLGALSAVALVPLDTARILPLVAALGLASVGWWGAVRAAARHRAVGGMPWAVVAGAVLLRLVALGAAPGLSDDAHRYVWEAGLVLAGQSPYAHAPDAPELAAFRERWPEVHAGVNHPEVSAAYPPLTQAVCAALVFLAGGVGADGGERALFFLRAGFAVCDLLLLIPLALLLARARRPAALVCVWGWSPLVVLEFAGTGHFDALGVLLLVAALCAGRRALASAALLAAGTLVKFLPILALPFVARTWRTPRRAVALFALLVAGGLAAPLLLRDGGLGLGAGLSEYAFRWESFTLLYRWIERPLASWFEADGGASDPRRLGRVLVGTAWLALAVLAWRRQTRHAAADRPELSAPRAVFFVLGAFLCLTPTLHPWYLTWIVPFLALFPSPAWLWLVGAAPLLYWPLERWRAEGVWVEPSWLWPLVALPFWILLLRPRRRGARAEAA